jgi:6-pyruvoyltetrahydropterin/6-carboxytetrahydropterin synthase
MSNYVSTKVIELGSCAFRQFGAKHSHCQYLHGYQLKGKFWFGCNTLDEKNWVVDFGGLKQLKSILQNQFDHTLCIADSDPCLPVFQQLHQLGACDLRIMVGGVGIEKTAEWCFNAADKFIKDTYGDRCWVEKVEVFEHELNSAIYHKPVAATYSVTTSDTYNFSDNTTVTQDTVHTPTPPPIAETQTPEPPPAAPTGPRPAQVGRGQVTTGWSNPFAGTSWGA